MLDLHYFKELKDRVVIFDIKSDGQLRNTFLGETLWWIGKTIYSYQKIFRRHKVVFSICKKEVKWTEEKWKKLHDELLGAFKDNREKKDGKNGENA